MNASFTENERRAIVQHLRMALHICGMNTHIPWPKDGLHRGCANRPVRSYMDTLRGQDESRLRRTLQDTRPLIEHLITTNDVLRDLPFKIYGEEPKPYVRPTEARRILHPRYTQLKTVWQSADGTSHKPKDMSTRHLNFSIALLEESCRNVREVSRRGLGKVYDHLGNQPSLRQLLLTVSQGVDDLTPAQLYPIYSLLKAEFERRPDSGDYVEIHMQPADDDWIRQY